MIYAINIITTKLFRATADAEAIHILINKNAEATVIIRELIIKTKTLTKPWDLF